MFPARTRTMSGPLGVIAGFLLVLGAGSRLAAPQAARPGEVSRPPAAGSTFAFQGRVFAGEVGDESTPLAGVTVRLFGANDPYPFEGALLESTVTNHAGAYGLTIPTGAPPPTPTPRRTASPSATRNTGGGLAAGFDGGVQIWGSLNVTGTKNFLIDHPLDPENRVLHHAAVESSEVLNVYSGNVVTDEEGRAVVALPPWFEAINTDFRYQLTVIGRFAQAIVEEEVKDGRFAVRTNLGRVKVSWQITARRNDAFMRAHPFVVEGEKAPAERGLLLAPEAFGQPPAVGTAARPSVAEAAAPAVDAEGDGGSEAPVPRG